MRRSIQIASACAFLMAAAGPVTGFGDGLAAEAEKLPCNNFCRTWMGFENGQAAAPQAFPAETVTVKPNEVSQDPESTGDDPTTRSAKPKSASQTDGEGKPSYPKPKRKAEPDVVDGSDHRSVAARSKTSKLAKSPRLDDVTVLETRSGSETSPSRRSQAEENVKTSSHDRNATSSQALKVTERSVPLPPRLPRSLRPSRTGVAQAGQNPPDEMRDGVVDEQPAGSRASSKAPRTVAPAPEPGPPQADAPQAAMGNIASAASKPRAKPVDGVSTGLVGDSAAASPPSLAGANVTPLVNAPRVAPQTDQPRPAVPDLAKSPPITTTPPTVDGTAVPDAPLPAGRAVASASVSDGQAARVAPRPEAPAPAAAVAAEPAAKDPPNTIGTRPAVAVQGTMAAAAPPPQGRAILSPSNPDKGAAQAAPPLAVMVSGETAAKHPPSMLATGPATTVDGTMTAAPPSPEGRAFRPLSAPDKGAVGVASQAAEPPSAVVASGEAVRTDPPTTLGNGPAVAVDRTVATASPSPGGRAVGPVADLDKQSAEVASQAAVPSSAVVVSGEAAPKVPPATLGNGSAVVVGAVTDPEATSATASSGAARTNRSDDPKQPVAAFSNPPVPAVSGLSVPVPGQDPVHDDTAVTAMNEPHAAVSDIAPHAAQSLLALPNATSKPPSDNGGKAERPTPFASSPAKAAVGSGYGALGKIDKTDRAPPGETASIVMAPPPGTLSTDENPATLVKIAIGDVSTLPEGTTIAYTITNPATAPVDLLFVRCNAVDPAGTVVGSAFDYVENIPAGQQVKRVVRMASDVTALGRTLSCANDAATQ